MTNREMSTTKSRTKRSILLSSQSSIGRVTRSQSRNLSDSEDAHIQLDYQGRHLKRKLSTRINGLGEAIVQAPKPEQSVKARRVKQGKPEVLSSITENPDVPNLRSSVPEDENDSHHRHGDIPQDLGQPGTSSSNSVVTALTSYSAQQLTDLDKELIIDMLPSLSVASTKVLDLLAPADATVADIRTLLERMKSSDSRISIHLKALRGAFDSSRRTYGTDHYINTSLIHRALYGVGHLHSFQDNDVSRPDPILQKANLVTLVITLLTSTPGSENAPTLQHLDGCFPRPFLLALEGPSTSKSRSPAGSVLLHETFEVGLEIRTQLALTLLDIHQADSGYHPEWVISQVFFGDSDEVASHDQASDTSLHPVKVRGWNIPDLGVADLSAEKKNKVVQRVNLLRSHIQRNPESSGTDSYIDFEALDSLFPWNNFLLKAITWARGRVNEIERYLRRSGGVESVENALKAVTQRHTPSKGANSDIGRDKPPQKDMPTHSSQLFGKPSHTTTQSSERRGRHSEAADQMADILSPKNFDSPNAVARLRRREARLSARQPMRSPVRLTSPKTQLPHGDKSTTTAPTSNLPTISSAPNRLASQFVAFSSDQNQDDLRDQRNDDWVPQDADEGDRPYINQATDSQLPPDSSAGVLKSLSRQHREQEKENLYGQAEVIPRKKARFFNERQENAERINFDDSDSDEQASRARARKREKTQDAGENEETGEESDEFQLDDRLVDESRRNTSRRRPRRGDKAGSRSSEETERRLGDDATQERQIQRTGEGLSDTEAAREEDPGSPTAGDKVDHARVNRVAKTTVASQSSHKVQVRRPWEEASTSRLIELIENDDFGTSWAKIAKLNDPLLEGRGQVALKDKARNIKMDFLKARIALPVNFEDVRLNRNQIQILHDLGFDYQQDPERGRARVQEA